MRSRLHCPTMQFSVILGVNIKLNHIISQKSLNYNVHNIKNQILTATNWSHRNMQKKILLKVQLAQIFQRCLIYFPILHKNEFSLTVMSLGYILQWYSL